MLREIIFVSKRSWMKKRRWWLRALDRRGGEFYDIPMTLLYEGKAKRLWATENPDTLRMEFKNDATAFNGEKKAQFENKGRLNNEISTLIYGYLEEAGVPTHFVRKLDDTNVEVRKVSILMVEVIIRNFAAGSYCKRTGEDEGRQFSQPIIEFSYKSDALGDPLINDDYIREMGLATPEDLAHLRQSALQVNTILIDFFAKCGLKLVDFKLEFGRLTSDPSKIVLADEISPDGCRLWDLKTGEKMDKDRFRRDLGNVMEAYEEVLGRLKKSL
jgi:phosphoribosylaminoimidazole-succinocarboxamide synthase